VIKFMSKPKLTIDEQIEHMKSKGIQFHLVNESAAKNFLLKNNYYFKIKSYTKNYDTYTSTDKKGQYINLEFAYLFLSELINKRFLRHADYFKTNQHITSTLEFLQKIIDYYTKNNI
jgi:hypothetical protein